MNSRITRLLTEARSLIISEDNWIKKSNAKNELGYRVCATAPTACKFCAMGALERVYFNSPSAFSYSEFTKTLDLIEIEVEKVSSFQSLNWYNDSPETTHANIMNVFDNAIQASK